MAEAPLRRPNPIVELTLMRLREIGREPGVLFWAFGFPLLLSLALGIAFRVRGPEPVVVGALPGVSAEIQRALADAKVHLKALGGATAEAELRSGRVSFAGVIKNVSLTCVPEAKVGDYVLVHVGLAISIVDPQEAEETFRYLREMGDLDGLDATTPSPTPP